MVKMLRASRSGFDFLYDNSADAYSAVMCTDAREPRSASTWRKAIAKRSKFAPYFAEVWGWSDAQCARQYWKAADEDRHAGCVPGQITPLRKAQVTIPTRSVQSSLVRIAETWVFTVASEMPRRVAI